MSGAKPDKRQDIYSLGVIVYEMLTGKLPYGKPLESARQAARARYRPVKRYNPEVPIWMDRAIEKAVAKEPERRYALMSEFLRDLSRPNPKFVVGQGAPLIERDPVAVWKWLAIASLLLNLVLFWLLMR